MAKWKYFLILGVALAAAMVACSGIPGDRNDDETDGGAEECPPCPGPHEPGYDPDCFAYDGCPWDEPSDGDADGDVDGDVDADVDGDGDGDCDLVTICVFPGTDYAFEVQVAADDVDDLLDHPWIS
ncbi:hypothetical protein ACFL26_02015, partial [Patescibacteria group bacterium]